jgi:hypothetical protein
MKYRFATIVLLFVTFAFSVQAHPYFTDLGGFKLKQYREATQNELRKPFKSGKFEDGFEYDQYFLKADPSLYMVFEYAAGHTDLIWSIQISGTDATTDPGFQGVRFGMDQASVEKQFGKPTRKIDIEEYGQRWEYDKSNFSFEINPKGKLSSIKIKDISNEVYPKLDAEKIPRFTDILKILTSENNAEIAKLLAPDMELYRGSEILFFSKSFKTELATDYSNIFGIVRELSADLKKTKTNDPDEYEENLRVIMGQSPKHVIKFKKGHKITELVFSYEWDEFLLWEIRTAPKIDLAFNHSISNESSRLALDFAMRSEMFTCSR